MKLKAALAFVLAVVISATTVSAQTPNSDAAMSQPRTETRTALNLTDPGEPVAHNQAALPRLAVAPVTRQKSGGKSIWPTVAGVAIGGLVGVYAGMGILLSDEPCQPNCGPQIRKGFAVLIGAPIAGGLIGHWLGKR